jgi:hypothetical protein
MIFGSWPRAGESGVLPFFGHLQVPEIGNNLWSLSLIQSRGNLHRFYSVIFNMFADPVCWGPSMLKTSWETIGD